MANWCLSRDNYKTLEKIFGPDPPALSWPEKIRPLYKELKDQLHGNPVPPRDLTYCEEVYLRLDSGEEVEINQGKRDGMIGSNVVRCKIQKLLKSAEIKPVDPKTGWARLRQFLPPFRRCNQ